MQSGDLLCSLRSVVVSEGSAPSVMCCPCPLYSVGRKRCSVWSALGASSVCERVFGVDFCVAIWLVRWIWSCSFCSCPRLRWGGRCCVGRWPFGHVRCRRCGCTGEDIFEQGFNLRRNTERVEARRLSIPNRSPWSIYRSQPRFACHTQAIRRRGKRDINEIGTIYLFVNSGIDFVGHGCDWG